VHTVEARIGDNPVGEKPFRRTGSQGYRTWTSGTGRTPEVPYTSRRCQYTFRWWYEFTRGGKNHRLGRATTTSRMGPGERRPGLSGRNGRVGRNPPTKPNTYKLPSRFAINYTYADGTRLIHTSDGETATASAESELDSSSVAAGSAKATPPSSRRSPQGRQRLYVSKNPMGQLIDCIPEP